MSKVRLYGTFTEVRSTFSMPLKLVTTVVHAGRAAGRAHCTPVPLWNKVSFQRHGAAYLEYVLMQCPAFAPRRAGRAAAGPAAAQACRR
eukprot:COSAG06_NODE_100_length_24132_cov_93.237507_9_plen_89_part_00